MLEQIRLSLSLHGTERVALMVHMDCGAYGGSRAFITREAEQEHHLAELAKAPQTVHQSFPNLAIESYIADFDGLYKV